MHSIAPDKVHYIDNITIENGLQLHELIIIHARLLFFIVRYLSTKQYFRLLMLLIISQPVDFVAIVVQAVYTMGKSIYISLLCTGPANKLFRDFFAQLTTTSGV